MAGPGQKIIVALNFKIPGLFGLVNMYKHGIPVKFQ